MLSVYMTIMYVTQTLLLDSANPNATWWIKGDACDLVPGLFESVDIKWSGDVDLNDGKLQQAYRAYKSKLEFVSEIGLKTRQERCIVRSTRFEEGSSRTPHRQKVFNKR